MNNENKNRILARITTLRLNVLLIFILIINQSICLAGQVRDAEIETILLDWSNPIFIAAGLSPRNVKIFLIANPKINAFVSGGQNMFINTGLIRNAGSANAVIGVIAHETGHIAAGHLTRTAEVIKEIRQNQFVTTLLSIGTMALTSIVGNRHVSSDEGLALLGAGTEFSKRKFLAFTRANERAADTAALRYLELTGRSPKALLGILEKLYGQELLIEGRQDPYVRSHPLTPSRMNHIKSFIAQSSFSDIPESQKEKENYLRIAAKLAGFLESPGRVLINYPETDKSVSARYARTIAFYRTPLLTKSMESINALINDYPNDPYFHELKGQMYYERGDPKKAVISYKKSLGILPDHPLLLLALASAELAIGDIKSLEEAKIRTERALFHESNNLMAWRIKGSIHNRLGETPEADLSASESAIRIGNIEDAERFAERALKKLNKNSPAALRATDILQLVKQIRNNKRI